MNYVPVVVMPSEREYERLNDLAEAIAQAHNPHCWKGPGLDIDPLMLPVIIADLEETMGKEMEELGR